MCTRMASSTLRDPLTRSSPLRRSTFVLAGSSFALRPRKELLDGEVSTERPKTSRAALTSCCSAPPTLAEATLEGHSEAVIGAYADFRERFIGWNSADIEDICKWAPTQLQRASPNPGLSSQTKLLTVTVSTVVARCS